MAMGHVFLSYAHEDLARVRPLMEQISGAGLAVFWDKDIPPGAAWRDVLQDMLDTASCTVVVWSSTSVRRDFVLDEASRAYAARTLVQVKVDGDAEVPLGFGEGQYVDLSVPGEELASELQRLLHCLARMVSDGKVPVPWEGSFAEDDWHVATSRDAIHAIRGLTGRVRSIGELLAIDSGAARDLRGALDEVGKTYRAVNTAIQDFLRPGLKPPPLDGETYLGLERSLLERIKNGRGHCGQIAVHYGRFGGLRDVIKEASPELLEEADQTLGVLSTADGDLFAQLEQIGGVLRNESRVIVNLLLAGDEDAARSRIALGHQQLQPIEDELAAALSELQDLEVAIGYAYRAPDG